LPSLPVYRYRGCICHSKYGGSRLEKLAEYSRCLRRDRELVFYGSEDLAPMDFYRETDARQARAMAQETIGAIIELLDRQP
jgi:hypothetical protein